MKLTTIDISDYIYFNSLGCIEKEFDYFTSSYRYDKKLVKIKVSFSETDIDLNWNDRILSFSYPIYKEYIMKIKNFLNPIPIYQDRLIDFLNYRKPKEVKNFNLNTLIEHEMIDP